MTSENVIDKTMAVSDPPVQRGHRLATLRQVGTSLGGRRVLDGVNFHIESGEIVTVVGPNGSGKTTLLRLLIGALAPDSGSVERAETLRIGYVPQRLHIDPTLPLTVKRFLVMAQRPTPAEVTDALAAADAVHLADRQMATLSGGEFQRVMLARALLADPQLLILDEATQGLDQGGSIAFYNRIAAVRDTIGCAILMVSHELHVVMAASDRVVCLNGHVCCEGTPEHVSEAPEYLALFGSDSGGALAVYRHEHDHHHHHDADPNHEGDRPRQMGRQGAGHA